MERIFLFYTAYTVPDCVARKWVTVLNFLKILNFLTYFKQFKDSLNIKKPFPFLYSIICFTNVNRKRIVHPPEGAPRIDAPFQRASLFPDEFERRKYGTVLSGKHNSVPTSGLCCCTVCTNRRTPRFCGKDVFL